MKFSEVEEWKIPEGDVYQVKDKKTGHVLWRKKLNLTLTASPAEGGACYTPGKYFYNSTAAVNAVPNAGYKFLKWDDENTNASREITMTGDMSYVAIFQ